MTHGVFFVCWPCAGVGTGAGGGVGVLARTAALRAAADAVNCCDIAVKSSGRPPLATSAAIWAAMPFNNVMAEPSTVVFAAT